jgi:hypothetical protein
MSLPRPRLIKPRTYDSFACVARLRFPSRFPLSHGTFLVGVCRFRGQDTLAHPTPPDAESYNHFRACRADRQSAGNRCIFRAIDPQRRLRQPRHPVRNLTRNRWFWLYKLPQRALPGTVMLGNVLAVHGAGTRPLAVFLPPIAPQANQNIWVELSTHVASLHSIPHLPLRPKTAQVLSPSHASNPPSETRHPSAPSIMHGDAIMNSRPIRHDRRDGSTGPNSPNYYCPMVRSSSRDSRRGERKNCENR